MQPDPETLRGNWSYPTAIRFGSGRVRELADACKALGTRRPLLVTDPGLAALPMVKDALAANERAGIPTALFSEVRANPVLANVEAGVAAFRAGGHDGVIAFGGGSALDCAKAIAFMIPQTRPIWDFEDVGDWWTRAATNGIAPIVAVPTTAGTGSEVGRAAVITDEQSHVKKIIFHPKMLPGIVLADPELLVGLPPQVTAATGMDALAHNLEAYCAPGHHPIADGIAVEGMRLGREWLPAAVADGRNLSARAYTLCAAHMGAAAFQKGLGAIHALSHPLGAVLGTHHGLANGVFMPYVLAFNREAIDEKMARVGRYLGLAKPGFGGVLDWVLALREQIGIPHTARDLGLREGDLDRFAGLAAADPTAAGNPVPVGPGELREIYAAALAGRIDA
ncbi:MAG: iron-containing alcohol dehydrogenase [Deltaproteobacteria bacterium]|nr:iron-containing alcohol dehydrogenase [Deltaproteobacteria bacterium]